MAIFKRKTKESAKGAKEAKTPPVVSAKTSLAHSYAHVLLSPRITEKASDLSAQNAYVFNVDPRAGKKDIAAAVRAVYKVSPVRIATITVPRKKTFVRGRKGHTGGGKKAVVYIKKGEKIEFV